MTTKPFFTSIKALAFFTILLGIVYPLFIFISGQIFFRDKANGSIYIEQNTPRGSFLIAQEFTSAKYFQPRPSSINYNPLPSGGSNFSLTSSRLQNIYLNNKNKFISANNLSAGDSLPQEMLFASGSGVDPNISKLSAYLQAGRVSKARNFDKLHNEKLFSLIDSLSEYPQFGFLGCEVVNVLKLNIKLDNMSKQND